jgi:hypothetical protein
VPDAAGVGQVRGLIGEFQPDTVVTFGPEDLMDRKFAALQAHRSQTSSLIHRVGAEQYRRWWSAESFVDAALRSTAVAAADPLSVKAPVEWLRPRTGVKPQSQYHPGVVGGPQAGSAVAVRHLVAGDITTLDGDR